MKKAIILLVLFCSAIYVNGVHNRISLNRQLGINCFHFNDSIYFRSPCDWSSDHALSNETGTCKPFISHSDRIVPGRNFYLIGNSVTRHYSFHIEHYFDHSKVHDYIELTRHDEKKLCGGAGRSCIHFIDNNASRAEFSWMNTLGSKPDTTDSRDYCSDSGNDTSSNTEQCLEKFFVHAMPRDVLIISCNLVNSETYRGQCDPKDVNCYGDYHGKIRRSENSYEKGPVSAHDTLEMITRVFPGAIIWLPYPYELNADPSTIQENNHFVREAIHTFCSERILFLNTYPLLRDYHQLYYTDHIHHPGVLTNMVIDAIFSTLTSVA